MESSNREQYRSKLTNQQWRVCFEHGTDPPFSHELNANKAEGIYKSIASGAPLFSSKDKFDSGSGWPSFVKPLEGHEDNVKETRDTSHGMVRVEVSCKTDGVHLGHVFDDGPRDRGGLRYCINGSSIEFVPKDKLTDEEKQKYGF